MFSIFCILFFVAGSAPSFANDQSDTNSAPHHTTPSKAETPFSGREASADQSSDCRQGMTSSDREILLKIESELSKVKDAGIESNIFKNRVTQLVEEHYNSLTPIAKAFFVQMALKHRFEVLDGKEFKRALMVYTSQSDFHLQTFGPGGTYASMGTLDILLGKADEVFSKSLKDLADADKALSDLIVKKHKAGQLSDTQKSEILALLRENWAMHMNRNNVMLDATVERIKANQKTILLTAGAAIATVTTLGAASGTFAGVLGTTATTAFVGAGSGVAGTIFAGQAQMLARAAARGGDIGCEFALEAIKGNDKLAKDALIGGLIGAAGGAGIGKLLGMGGRVATGTAMALKGLAATGITVGAFGTGANAKTAMDEYAKARELAALSDEAYEAKDFKKAQELANQAKEALKKAQDSSIGAASSAINTALAAIGLASIGKLRSIIKQADDAIVTASKQTPPTTKTPANPQADLEPPSLRATNSETPLTKVEELPVIPTPPSPVANTEIDSSLEKLAKRVRTPSPNQRNGIQRDSFSSTQEALDEGRRVFSRTEKGEASIEELNSYMRRLSQSFDEKMMNDNAYRSSLQALQKRIDDYAQLKNPLKLPRNDPMHSSLNDQRLIDDLPTEIGPVGFQHLSRGHFLESYTRGSTDYLKEQSRGAQRTLQNLKSFLGKKSGQSFDDFQNSLGASGRLDEVNDQLTQVASKVQNLRITTTANGQKILRYTEHHPKTASSNELNIERQIAVNEKNMKAIEDIMEPAFQRLGQGPRESLDPLEFFRRSTLQRRIGTQNDGTTLFPEQIAPRDVIDSVQPQLTRLAQGGNTLSKTRIQISGKNYEIEIRFCRNASGCKVVDHGVERTVPNGEVISLYPTCGPDLIKFNAAGELVPAPSC